LKETNVVVVSEDGQQIRRCEPLPEEDGSLPRSIYAKRFPANASLDDLTQFFGQFGKVKCVRMQRRVLTDPSDETKKSRLFNGAVFIEFDEDSIAKTLTERKDILYTQKAEGEEKGEKKESDEPLYIVMKEQYLKDKEQKREKGKDGKKNDTPQAGTKRKAEDSDFPKGTIVRAVNIGENLDRFKIKEIVEACNNAVRFVEVQEAEEGKPRTAIVRMCTAEGAEKAIAHLTEKKVEFGGVVPTFSLLGGDEETEYWQKIADKTKDSRGRGGGRGRGGRGGGRNKRRRR
jgi:RNA recognition motif-containing protein